MSAEDTILTITKADGMSKSIPIPKGTTMGIDTPALHYNRTSYIIVHVRKKLSIESFAILSALLGWPIQIWPFKIHEGVPSRRIFTVRSWISCVRRKKVSNSSSRGLPLHQLI